MAAYICKICGADVWAEAGREIRTSIQHGQDAGHPDGGLCLPNSAHARQLRVRRPVSGFTIRQESRSRARRRWDALPLQLRVVIFFMAVGVATIASTALADALDDTPVFTSCHDRIAC